MQYHDRIETTNPDFNNYQEQQQRNSQAMVDNGLVFTKEADNKNIDLNLLKI